MSFGKFKNVKLVKFKEIDEVDLAFFEKSLERFFQKVGPDAKLELYLKDYAKGGLRVQHEVKGTLYVGSKTFFSTSKGWKLFSVVSKVLSGLVKNFNKDSKKK
ncbi:MAG: hypothetical protein ACOX1V_00795 [Candidatus Iainarchaeum sp.]|nr:MAG: hypothetical protein BWY55_00001 [archaeon ADurb.Bin336]